MNQYKDSQGNVFDEDQLRIKAQEQGIEFGEFLADFQRVGSIKTEGTVEGKDIKQPKVTEIKTNKPKTSSDYLRESGGKTSADTVKERNDPNFQKIKDKEEEAEFKLSGEFDKTKQLIAEGDSLINVNTENKYNDLSNEELFDSPEQFKEVQQSSSSSMVYQGVSKKPSTYNKKFYINPLTGEEQEEKPFEKQLKQSFNILKEQNNGIDPSDEEVYAMTRDQLIKNEKASKRTTLYKDSIKKLTPVKRGSIADDTELELETINTFVDNETKDTTDALAALDLQFDQMINDSEAAQWLIQFNEDFVNTDTPTIFGKSEENEGTFDITRSDGKVITIPGKYYEQYVAATLEFKAIDDDLLLQRKLIVDAYEDTVNDDVIDKADALSLQINMLKRDYNLAAKARENFTVGAKLFGLGVADAFGDFENINKLQQEVREEQQVIAEKYSPDVSFDEAFSSTENFGEFALQESANQLPILLAMSATSVATGGLGLGAAASMAATGLVIGTSSYGRQEADMKREMLVSRRNEFKFDDIDYTNEQIRNTSLAFATFEAGFSAIPGSWLLNRGAKIMAGGGKRALFNGGWNYVQNNTVPGILVPYATESLGEGLTQLSQNLWTGRPALENVGHAVFTGGMFGGGLGGLSVAVGAVATKFSDYNSFSEIRDIGKNIRDIKESIRLQIAEITGNNLIGPFQKGDPKTKSKAKIKSKKQIEKIENEANAKIKELKQKQHELLKVVDKDIRDIADADFDIYAEITTRQELLRTKFQELQKSNKSAKVKRTEAIDLKAEFDFLQSQRDSFRNVKDTGDRGFVTLSEKDQKKYEDQGIENYNSENNEKSYDELSQKDKDKQTKKAYHTEKVNIEINKLNKFVENNDSWFKTDVKVVNTEEEAKKYFIEKQNVSEEEASKRVNGKAFFREKGKSGDRNQIVLIKDNMIQQNRAGTGFHEASHVLLFESLALDDKQTKQLAKAIHDWLYTTNRAAYTRMFLGKDRNKSNEIENNRFIIGDSNTYSEEVIVNFMEAVSQGEIDLTSVENRALTKMLGPLINNSLVRRAGLDARVDWKGEKDMVRFITDMAIKLKDGTFTEQDYVNIKENRSILKPKGETNTTVDESFKKKSNKDSEIFESNNEDSKSVSSENKKIAAEVNDIYENKDNNNSWVYDIYEKEIGTIENAIKLLPEAVRRGHEDDLRSEYTVEILQVIDNYDDRSRKITIDKNENQGINSGKTTLSVTYNKQSGDVRINKVKYKELKNASEQQIINFIEKNTKGKVLESKQIPISGYIQLAKQWRFLEANKRILPQKFQVSTDDVNFERSVSGDANFQTTQEDTSKTDDDIKAESQRVGGLIDPKSLIDEELVDQAKENISKKLKEIPLSGLTFKSLLDLSPETTGAIFGIPESDASLKNNTKLTPTWPEAEANGISFEEFKLTYTLKKLLPITNLTNKEYVNAALALDKMYDGLSKILPQGAIREKEVRVELYGTSAGLPNNILKALYEKQDRQGQNLAPFILAPLTREKFRTAIGLLPDGKPSNNMTNRMPEHQTTKGLVSLFGKLLTNTTVRQELQKIPGTEQTISDIAAGKSNYMSSEIASEINYNQEAYKVFFANAENFKNNIKSKKDINEFFNKNFGTIFENNQNIIDDLEKESEYYNKENHKTLGEFLFNTVLMDFKRPLYRSILNLDAGSLDFGNPDQIVSARVALRELAKELKDNEAIIKYLLPAITKGTTTSGLGKGIEFTGLEKYNDLEIKKGAPRHSLSTGRKDFFEFIFPEETNPYEKYKRYIETVEGEQIKIKSLKGTSNAYDTVVKEYEARVEQADDQKIGLIKIVDTLQDLYNSNTITPNDFGMIAMTLTSNANALVKSAAAPKLFIKDKQALETDLENLWKNADEKLRKDFVNKRFFTKNGKVKYTYEHVIPGRDLVTDILNKVKNNIKDDVFKNSLNDFQVALIPTIFDYEINRIFKDSSPLDDDGNRKKIKYNNNGTVDIPRYIDSNSKALYDAKGLPTDNFVITNDPPVSKKSSNSEIAMPLSDRFNGIVEETKGKKNNLAAANKVIPEVIARQKGATIGKYQFFVPPSADDFMGLMYAFMGQGPRGELHQQFFEETLNKPYKKGIAQLESAKQKIENDYKILRKKYPKLSKKLGKKMPDSDFTYDQAIRIWLWKSGGFDMKDTGLEPDKAEGRKLINDAFFAVAKDREMQQFARQVGLITKQEKGYIEPGRDWLVDNIASDLNSISDKIGRKQFLEEFTNNYKEIFSKQNLNKIEAIYGTRFRQSLEDILFRMEKGTNRNFGSDDARANAFADFLNGSVGTIMFFNSRSAALQVLSAANYVNWSDNNVLKAGAAFANQPQYWKDVVTLFNSDKLRQRRKGFKIDVNQAELANSVEGSQDSYKSALRFLLKIGFTPTQAADGLAIATGGAAFYRNRAKTYVNKGYELKEAEAMAFEDFSELTDKHQQSSDPSMVSEQQANKFSRFVLSFQNTSMQYNRMMKKAALDLANNRGNPAENVSKIVYYGFAQNFIFNALSTAMFAMAFDDEEEVEKKELRVVNNMVDTILRGSGYHGAIAAMLKNTAFEIYKQETKDYGEDYTYVALAITNVAPSIGSKFNKAYKIKQTFKYNFDLMKERGFYPGTLNPKATGKKESFGMTGASNVFDNPSLMVAGLATSVATNIPLDRVIKKVSNLTYVLDNQSKGWQKLALLFGFSTYDIGVKNSDGILIKERAQDERRKAGYKKSKKTRRKKNANTDALLKAGWTED